MNAPVAEILKPQAELASLFFATMYRHADPSSFIALRAFLQKPPRGRSPTVALDSVEAGALDLIERFGVMALRAANIPLPAAAYAPICTFCEADTAKTKDLKQGHAISVELDQNAQSALVRLTEVLGHPTIVVASGGRWTDIFGSDHPKLHLHWRLATPAAGAEALAHLAEARSLARQLSGGDPTCDPIVHPLRIPGSWHRKQGKPPTLVTMQACKPEREIELEAALAALRQAVPEPEIRVQGSVPVPENLRGEDEDIAAALAVIPNDDVDWDEWNRVLMAAWAASEGHAYEAAEAWSTKSDKHDPEQFEARWDHFGSCPPDRVGMGTLVHMATAAWPGWCSPSGVKARSGDAARLVQTHFVELPERASPVTSVSPSPHPMPLDLFPVDDVPRRLDLPADCLPGLLERWSSDNSERLGCAPAFTAVAAMTVVSAAIGARLRIQPKRLDTSWTLPAYLWAAIVEAPGGKKSPAVAAAIAPLAKLDAEHSAIDHAALRQWERRSKGRKADAPDPGPAPRVRRYKVDAFTMESLRRVLGDNPAGVLVSTDELTQLFGAIDAYKANKGADRPLLLRLFDGGAVTSDRVGAGSHHISNFGAAVIGGIQPRVIEKLAPDLDADGLLQRFIVVNGDGVRRAAVDRAPDAEAQAAYDALIGQLVGAEFRFPSPIRLGEDARDIWDRACRRIEDLFALQQVSDAWRGHLGKWQAILARITLVFHVVDRWSEHGIGIDEVAVSPDTMRRASRMSGFLLAQAVQFYGRYVGMGDAAENARWFAAYLLTHPNAQQLTERDVYQARHDLRGPDKRTARQEIFRQLELAGWCTPEEPPVRSWNVNPRIHELFGAQAEQQRIDREARRAEAIRAFEVRRGLVVDLD